MKRCSQCHFTFTDDQQFCDFDHTKLTDIPEPPPAFQNVRRGRARRLLRSRTGLAILALSGVAMSALLVGYFDSVNSGIDVASNSESPVATSLPSSLTPQASPVKKERALIWPASKPRRISTQRKLTANDQAYSMHSSILKWDVAPASRTSAPSSVDSTSSHTARSPQTLRRPTPSKGSATLSMVAMKRRVPSNASATRRQLVSGSNTTLARNHRKIREGNSGNEKLSRVVMGQKRKSGDGKDSKVVAILKKTGSFLTKPFRL